VKSHKPQLRLILALAVTCLISTLALIINRGSVLAVNGFSTNQELALPFQARRKGASARRLVVTEWRVHPRAPMREATMAATERNRFPAGGNPPSSVWLPADTYAVRTAVAQTSRRFLSRTKKDSFVQLPTLDSALSGLAAMARIS